MSDGHVLITKWFAKVCSWTDWLISPAPYREWAQTGPLGRGPGLRALQLNLMTPRVLHDKKSMTVQVSVAVDELDDAQILGDLRGRGRMSNPGSSLVSPETENSV